MRHRSAESPGDVNRIDLPTPLTLSTVHAGHGAGCAPSSRGWQAQCGSSAAVVLTCAGICEQGSMPDPAGSTERLPWAFWSLPFPGKSVDTCEATGYTTCAWLFEALYFAAE